MDTSSTALFACYNSTKNQKLKSSRSLIKDSSNPAEAFLLLRNERKGAGAEPIPGSSPNRRF